MASLQPAHRPDQRAGGDEGQHHGQHQGGHQQQAVQPGPAVGGLTQGAIQIPQLGLQGWATALGLMVAIGLLVGALPALRAMRLNIVDALAGR